MLTASDLTRPEKHKVALGLVAQLVARQQQGPEELALDAFIPELQTVSTALGTNVDGMVLEDGKRRAALALLDAADDDVDTWLRHHEAFLRIEAGRRTGSNAAAARALYAAALPDGLAHVDDYIPTENDHCRKALVVLGAPEHAEIIAAIGLPPVWQAKWLAALDESDAAFAAAQEARVAKRTHVGKGQDAEADFVDAVVRLRRYLASRPKRGEKAKAAEGRALLEPLLTALEKAEKERATRETKKTKKAKKQAPQPQKEAPQPQPSKPKDG